MYPLKQGNTFELLILIVELATFNCGIEFWVPEVIQSTCTMAACDLSDLYALSPQALGIQIIQILRANVTIITLIIYPLQNFGDFN